MSRFVIDSNVVSEIVRPRPEPRVAAFLKERSDLWLSAIVFHELAYGVARLAQGARVEVLNNYIEQMKRRFHGRIVAIDLHLAEVAGRLRGAESKRGRTVPILDSFIAATAIAKGGTLITRNIKHFQGLGFPVANPWED
jgi:predicted nucleic acid-binding protein